MFLVGLLLGLFAGLLFHYLNSKSMMRRLKKANLQRRIAQEEADLAFEFLLKRI